MCGIAGFIERPASAGESELRERALAMAQAIGHRGPDRRGSWADAKAGVALGHARLSILDLSALGDQPMHSESRRYSLVFNGEIYNFRALRAELEKAGHAFRGHSDTEVMLAAFEHWGIEPSLGRFDGMFAFALWDAQDRALWLARDRIGEKPLYYGWSGRYFAFGSELKALAALPGFRPEIDREAVRSYFDFACVPAPATIFEGIKKLRPGHFAVLREQDRKSPETRAYWRLQDEIAAAQARPFQGTDAEAIDALDGIVKKAVRDRMVSDVPLGAFLSGGIDSALITAAMQSQSSEPVRTFTIGFSERDYNEADHASAVAAHLGTSHSARFIEPKDVIEAIPRMPSIYDEPFADSSQLATYLLAQHARKEVKVSLSGDAGDEWFAGYHRHFAIPKLWSRISRLPRGVRSGTAMALGEMPPSAWKALARLKPGARPAIVADQMRKLIDIFPSANAHELYLKLLSHQRGPAGMVPGVTQMPAGLQNAPELGSLAAQLQYYDAMVYLPDDILTKVDRATMAVGLEARVPFLAPEIVAFAWSLPERMKVRDGEGKWLLRRLLERYLPKELILKPKSGFRVPIGHWMRHELRDWCETLLAETSLRQQDYIDAGQVRKLWQEHLSGRHDHEYILWSILMFRAWLVR